jgi:hypothetical protein
VSLAKNFAKSSGEPPTGSFAAFSMLSRTFASCSDLAYSALRRAMTSFGVLSGTNTPNH